jgi:hypothetical protein
VVLSFIHYRQNRLGYTNDWILSPKTLDWISHRDHDTGNPARYNLIYLYSLLYTNESSVHSQFNSKRLSYIGILETTQIVAKWDLHIFSFSKVVWVALQNLIINTSNTFYFMNSFYSPTCKWKVSINKGREITIIYKQQEKQRNLNHSGDIKISWNTITRTIT